MILKEGATMKTTTIRISDDLDRLITEYARQNDISKNQAIKDAIRKLLKIK